MAAREENIGGAFPFLLLVSALRIFTPQYNPFTSTVFITPVCLTGMKILMAV